MSSSLSASTALRMSSGMAAKASLVGAKIVNGPSLFSVSTRSASPTAVTRVESSGFAEAAVAAVSSAMPANEPSPSVGTAAQPGPKAPSMSTSPMSSDMSSDGATVSTGSAPVSVSSPQAANRSPPAAMTAPTRSRFRVRRGVLGVLIGLALFCVRLLGGEELRPRRRERRRCDGPKLRLAVVRSGRRSGLPHLDRWRGPRPCGGRAPPPSGTTTAARSCR